MSKTFENPAFESIQSDIFQMRLEWRKALDVMVKVCRDAPDLHHLHSKKIQLQQLMFKKFNDRTFLDDAQTTSQELLFKFPNNHGYRKQLIQILILAEEFDQALSEIEQLPKTKNELTMKLLAWKQHMEGDIASEKQTWVDIQRIHHVPQIEPLATEALLRKDENPLSIVPDEIILFTVVRNELWRLPWFLSYYRSLGVNRFFFVDNDSDDGTQEFLLKQPDVHVFWTPGSYAKSYSGMKWVNDLVSRHGDQGWCMYIDVDEAFVFPNVEHTNLRELTDYMDSKGQEALYAFMIDMFSDEELEPSADGIERDFIAHYPLFDNYYNQVPSIHCPYIFTSGGARRIFKFHENLTKTPLVRGGRGIKYLMSSHCVTPAILSDVTGAMLHFKLAGDYQKIFAADLESNTRMPFCKRRHASYVNHMEKEGGKPRISNPTTLCYTSSKQLIELGLIQTSRDFSSRVSGSSSISNLKSPPQNTSTS